MYLQAWRTLFSLIQPDVVLFEHSPTALIAAHDKTFRKVLVGNGFFVPSPGSDPHAPFLPFPTTQLSPEVVAGLMHDDAALLACINRALFGVNAPPLPALHAMFNQVDASLLMTWPELDHFGAQAQRKYMGVEPPLARVSPQWPEGEGPRVFGYLSAIPSLETLLNDLVAAQVCALLFVRNLPPTLRERFSGPQMRFADQPVDLAEVARQAAWVINSGNHSTAATFAAAGVPQLIIPLHQEHLFMALRLVSQGSAVMAFQDQSAYSAAISALQTNPRIREKARALQAQIPPYDATAAHSLVAQALSLHRT
jgi:UDP:flavonoid glycosyltransferase YjiC (YdhE family)